MQYAFTAMATIVCSSMCPDMNVECSHQMKTKNQNAANDGVNDLPYYAKRI